MSSDNREHVQKWRDNHPDENKKRNVSYSQRYRDKHRDEKKFKENRQLSNLKYRLKQKTKKSNENHQQGSALYSNRNTLI